MESSKASVGRDNAMTRYVRRERIAPKGLAHGLRAAASYAVSKFAVGYSRAARHLKEGEVDLTLKGGDCRVVQYAKTDGGNIGHRGIIKQEE